MNADIYFYIQNIALNDLVKVAIIVGLKSKLASYIESRGFIITNIGYTSDSQFIYAELSKEFIIELAFSDESPYIQGAYQLTVPA